VVELFGFHVLKRSVCQGGGGFGGFGTITKKVYAVRANHNRLLDVARETYRENVTDIIELQDELSKEHDLPLALLYQDSGFVFTLKKGDVPEGTKLPAPFINVSAKKNGRWTFSHLELVSACGFNLCRRLLDE
jgi:DNA mismatch repair protein MSH4